MLIYRVHDEPSIEKLNALSEFLVTIGIKLAKGQVLRPAQFNGILNRVRATEHEHLVNEVVLALPGPGGICGRQLRPFRPEPAPLRAFHLAHPPLCRPHRASRPDPRLRSWRRRPAGFHEERTGRDRSSDLSRRTTRHGGRARDGRPPHRGLSRRPDRRHIRGPDLRRDQIRPVRSAFGDRRGWLRAGLDAGRRIFPFRRSAPRHGRLAHRRQATGSATSSRSSCWKPRPSQEPCASVSSVRAVVRQDGAVRPVVSTAATRAGRRPGRVRHVRRR